MTEYEMFTFSLNIPVMVHISWVLTAFVAGVTLGLPWWAFVKWFAKKSAIWWPSPPAGMP